MKAICDKCDKIATWVYMPSGGQYCEDHVPRGCACQLEEDGEYISANSMDEYNEVLRQIIAGTHPLSEKHRRDSSGRLMPCIEYWDDPSGFEADEDGNIDRIGKINKLFGIDENV